MRKEALICMRNSRLHKAIDLASAAEFHSIFPTWTIQLEGRRIDPNRRLLNSIEGALQRACLGD